MNCLHIGAIAAGFLLAACGGSSSETPMPLEPVPHTGPEPEVEQGDPPAERKSQTVGSNEASDGVTERPSGDPAASSDGAVPPAKN